MKHVKQIAFAVLLASAAGQGIAGSIWSSPFGKASPEEDREAKAQETARLNALAAWNYLPSAIKTMITKQLEPLNSEQRLALLNKIPVLNQLSVEQKQMLLDQIAQVVPLPNAPPVAKLAVLDISLMDFVPDPNNPSSTVPRWLLMTDAGESSDPDGQIASRTFTVANTATGATFTYKDVPVNTALELYGNNVAYDITLTVTDDKGAQGATTVRYVTPQAPTPNLPPTLDFSVDLNWIEFKDETCTSRWYVTIDASASHDADGQIVTYEYAISPNGAHGVAGGPIIGSTWFGADGYLSVFLKVTDDKGASVEATKTLRVPAPKQACPYPVNA